MEESVNWQFDVYMQEMFHMKEVDIREYSPRHWLILVTVYMM